MPFLMLVIPFFLAQGAAVFGTAYLALRLFKASGWRWKVAATTLSYLGWIVFTVAAFAVMGGEGGPTDGFGSVLFLSATALVSSIGYLLVWLVMPARRQTV